MIILIIICSVLSAIFYRAGGMDKQTEHWIPKWLRKTAFRDWVCPLFVLLPIVVSKFSWPLLGVAVLTYLPVGGALTTYWDFMFEDYDNFWFSGFMCGVALFPLFFVGIGWYVILLRALFLEISWGLICTVSDNDFIEEYLRGALLPLSVLIILA